MTALVFDFGLKHIGIAVAFPAQNMARGIATIQARNGTPDWPALDALVAEWRPQQLVVGDPLNMDGTRSCMAERARQFGSRLAERYVLTVDYVDERLSTFEANSRGATRQNSHALAAETIAETWLGLTACRP